MPYVLIVDDDEMIAEMASDVLLAAGYACGWVTSGEDAMDLLKWREPDLMLLDQDMPGMSGAQVLRKVRSSERHYDLPVIMFTAMSGAEDEEQARYNGAQDYIRKPFDAKFLVWKARQVIRSHRERAGHRDLKNYLAQANGLLGSQPVAAERHC